MWPRIIRALLCAATARAAAATSHVVDDFSYGAGSLKGLQRVFYRSV